MQTSSRRIEDAADGERAEVHDLNAFRAAHRTAPWEGAALMAAAVALGKLEADAGDWAQLVAMLVAPFNP